MRTRIVAHDFRPGGSLSGGLYGEFNPYPAPRTNRGRGIPTNNAQPITATLPNVRLWNFYIETEAANRRSLVASPRFVGPVFIDTLNASWITPGRTVPMSQFCLYYANSPYTTVHDSADVSAQPGTPLYEYTASLSDGAGAQANSGTLVPDLFGVASTTMPIRKYLTNPEVFLAAFVISRVAGAYPFAGSLRLYENVQAEIAGELLTR